MQRLTVRFVLFCGALYASRCAGQLEKFLDEDKEIVISYAGDNSSSLNIDASGGFITVEFSADRFVNYSIRYGADCTSGSLAATLPQSGSAEAGQSVSARMNYTELMANGGTGIICVADKAAYKKASLSKTFSTTAITNNVTLYNETNGGSGAPQSNGTTTEFQLFQVAQAAPGWSNNSVNRDGGTTQQNGVTFPFGLLTAIDPNDGYKRKLFVTDRNNHRILVFHSIPQSNSAQPDVVIGQPDFVTGSAGLTQAKFDWPMGVAVCADGKLYIADRNNNRVAGFNQVPRTSGAAMDFVLGQISFTVNATGTTSTGFNSAYGVSCISGRLYVTDRYNHRIVVYGSLPTSNVAASFAIGQPNLTTATAGADYTSVQSYLDNPSQVLYSGSQFFIADINNHRVLVYNSLPTAALSTPSFVIGQLSAAGTTANQCTCTTPGQTTLYSPRGLAYRSGKLAIGDTDNNRIMFFDLPITANTPLATHQMGQTAFTVGGATAAARGTFASPKDVLFDGNYIWVADASNNRVQYIALPF